MILNFDSTLILNFDAVLNHLDIKLKSTFKIKSELGNFDINWILKRPGLIVPVFTMKLELRQNTLIFWNAAIKLWNLEYN